MGSTTPLLDILSAHLPIAIAASEPPTDSLPTQTRTVIETLLAFALGAECPPRLPEQDAWARAQPGALKALQNAVAGSSRGAKRTREHEDSGHDAKRQKTASDDDKDKTSDVPDDADDPPRFTFPALSITSPIRKKADVSVHARTLRLVHSGTRALEAVVSLGVARAFVLPTRGKGRGHWTVVLLPGDVPDQTQAKGKATASGQQAQTQQVVFGIDAQCAATFETKTYNYGSTSTSTSVTTTTVAKGTATLPALRALLAHIPAPLLEPSTSVFRSACASSKSGECAAGIDAYLAARAGTLWFFDGGILWESRPCEFWAVSDLVKGDGVRMVSATGRTCSVILCRKKNPSEAGEGEDPEGDVVETVFSMVDGKEQDPIHAWARNRKHLFGKRAADVSPSRVAGGSRTGGVEVSRNKDARSGPSGVNGSAKGPAWDDSDPDDDDFEASSEDLENSSTDADSGDGGSADGSRSAQESGDDASEDGGDEEEEELLEAHHPLLRPGAMPRMSKAALEMVVDMVQGDLGDEASEEEDELEE